jgi:hypothetical protein
MLKGYRRYILAALACLILSAQAPRPETQPKQAEVSNQVGKSAQTIPPPPFEPVQPVQRRITERPCEPGQDNRQSELCAQWKAADAATDAAYWAWASFWLGLAGTVGLIATLYYTRKAVLAAEEATKDADKALEIAARNADAAAQQVTVAQSTARHQLRAYIGVAKVTLDVSSSNMIMDRITVTVALKNFGQTPARVHTFLWLTIHDEAKEFSVPEHVPPREYLAPGATTEIVQRLSPPSDDSERLRNGQARLHAIARFEYEDIFGADHGHSISWISAGDNYRHRRFERLDENRATHRPAPGDAELA